MFGIGWNQKTKKQTISRRGTETIYPVPDTLITILEFTYEVLEERCDRDDDMDRHELADLLQVDPNGFLKALATEITEDFYEQKYPKDN